MSLYIIGQGGHASSIAYAALEISKDRRNICPFSTIVQIDMNTFTRDRPKGYCIIGFGDLRHRRQLINNQKYLPFTSVVHPTATISECSTGSFVGANSYIGPLVRIGRHCIINTHAIIEHDCIIGENVHISVNSTLCGNVRVDDDTFIGAGCTIIPNIHIGTECYIAAGTTVTHNIEPGYFFDGKTLALRRSKCPKTVGSLSFHWCAKKPIDFKSVQDILQPSIVSNQFTNNGPIVKELESFIKQSFQLKNEVHMASSGTAALHALVSGINIMHGNELRYATQAFTFPSSVLGPLKNSIILDQDPEYLGPCMKQLTIRKDAFDGVIITNVFGTIVDVHAYRKWCDDHSKTLIFDNAATPVAFVIDNNVPASSGSRPEYTNVCDIADASIISFHETKFFGRGEGGAIICTKKLWPFVNRAVNFGFDFGTTIRRYHIEASNHRMSDFAAAFLLQYLKVLCEPKSMLTFFEISNHVRTLIEAPTITDNVSKSSHNDTKSDHNDSKSLSFLFQNPCKTVYSGLCLRAPIVLSNETIAQMSIDTNIELKKYYVPLIDDAPIAWSLYNHVICIPFHFQTSKADVTEMITRITKWLAHYIGVTLPLGCLPVISQNRH